MHHINRYLGVIRWAENRQYSLDHARNLRKRFEKFRIQTARIESQSSQPRVGVAWGGWDGRPRRSERNEAKFVEGSRDRLELVRSRERRPIRPVITIRTKLCRFESDRGGDVSSI